MANVFDYFDDQPNYAPGIGDSNSDSGDDAVQTQVTRGRSTPVRVYIGDRSVPADAPVVDQPEPANANSPVSASDNAQPAPAPSPDTSATDGREGWTDNGPAQPAPADQPGIGRRLLDATGQVASRAANSLWDLVKVEPGKMQPAFGTTTSQEDSERPQGAFDRIVTGLGDTAYRAATLPGDVFTGKTPVTDAYGNTNPEVIARAADLAGLATAIPYASAPEEGMVLGVGKRGKGVGVADTGVRGMAAVPDIRGMSLDDAIALARQEPHPIPSGKGSEGYFVGGPRTIQSKADLDELRRQFDEFIARDTGGADWYDRYRNFVAEVTGNNPARNEMMARQEGQWSAGASPESELNFAVKENNSAINGTPVKAGRPASHEAFQRAIENNDPTQLARGKKTGEYAWRINPDNADIARDTATGVNDFRYQRQWGYINPDGTLPSSGNHMVGDTIHKFMDYETALALDRARQNMLGGMPNWNGEMIQATPWVVQKAESLMSRNKNLSYEDAFRLANSTIGDYYPKHTLNVTHEPIPGSTTGHLTGLQSADQATRDAFARDPRSRWSTGTPGGQDSLYFDLAHPNAPGVAMRVRPSVEYQGIYTQPDGKTVFNLGENGQPLVAFDNSKEKGKLIAKSDRQIVETGEAIRAYVDAQNAGGTHILINDKAGRMGSVNIPMKRKMTADEAQKMAGLAKQYGFSDVSDRGNGITLTNFGGEQNGTAVGKLLKGSKKQKPLGDAIKEIIPDAGDPNRAKVDSTYTDYTNAWKRGTGSGAATRQLLKQMRSNTKVARAAWDANPSIPLNALNRMERDAAYAGSDTIREDIQNARRIISQGPGWQQRLADALKRKELLPVVALPLLAPAMPGIGSAGSESQQ